MYLTNSVRANSEMVKFTKLLIWSALIGLSPSICADIGEARAIQPGQIEFEQIAPFVQMGAAWGNRQQGKHGTFGVFPGGASSPLHTHSGAYHGVVISGVMINPFEQEQSPIHMGPGGYWYVPANVEHVTACVSEEPCVFYFHADGAFDFTPSGQ